MTDYQAPLPPQPQPQVIMVQAQKSVGVAYLLWAFTGVFGGHQFYLGKIGRGLLYLFTLGGLGIGLLIDLFTLSAQARQVNSQIASGYRQA